MKNGRHEIDCGHLGSMIMFKTEDNYNLYFDGMISQAHETNFKELIEKHQLDPKILDLLKINYNFTINDSYSLHQVILWLLYKTLESYAITIIFSETDHPYGCEYQSKVDFYVEANGSFDYELKNSIFFYADSAQSEECKKRIKERSIGFDKDCRVKGNVEAMDLESFVKSIA
jgi:hypothetical protein